MADTDQRTEADMDLLQQLRRWKQQNEEIILMGAFNQNIYTSNFARQLAEDDLGMEEQYQKLHGEEAPLSYVRSTEPIMGCFATSGTFVRSYFMAAHHASRGVGDHRLHEIDFCAASILGAELPAVTKKVGRRLQYKLKPTRMKYRKDLVKTCKQHKMEEKSHVMMQAENFSAEAEHNDARESFDRQHTELQIACEKKCRKFRIGRSEYTPLLASTNRHEKIYK